MNTTSRFLAGIFSMILIGGVIIAPLYIAEKLENIETSQDGIVSMEEVVSSNSSVPTGNYLPYSEYDEETRIEHTWDSVIYSHNLYYTSGSNYDNDANVELNVDGNIDYTEETDHMSSSGHRFHFSMEISPSQWIVDDIDTVRFYMDLDRTWNIYRCYVIGYSDEWTRDYLFNFVRNATHSQERVGEFTHWFIFSESELNTIASSTSGYAHVVLDISIAISTHYWGDPIYFQVEVHPDFYQEMETTWNNQTVTTYEPYDQIITTYAVHKVSMILGGILILGLGWIASPFNKNFDDILPINKFKRRNRT